MYPNTTYEVHSMDNESFSGDYALSAQYLYYLDQKGEVIKIEQSELKSMNVNDQYFELHHVYKKGGPKRLHEILIKGENFTITQYFGGLYYELYIFDATETCTLGPRRISNDAKDDTKTFNTYVKPLLKYCPDYIAQIEDNLVNNYAKYEYHEMNRLFESFANSACE